MQDQLDISPLDIGSRMERLADEGEWQEIEALSRLLRDAVLRVPEAERPDVLARVQQSHDYVQSLASKAHLDIKEQLSALRRGKAAAEAYNVTDQMAQLR